MKINRINEEITRTREKVSDLQSRLKELERQKTEAENTGIVAAVRSANIDHQELLAFIHAYRTQGATAETMLQPNGPEQEDFEDDEA